MDHNVLLSELNNLDVDLHLVRWITAFLSNRGKRVRIGNSLSALLGLIAGHHRVPNSFLPPALLNSRKWNGTKCKSRVKYVDDATAIKIIPR